MDIASPHSQPPAELDRLAVLASFDVGGLIDDPRLTAITDFAATLCQAPIALVSFVEEKRQWFAARTGIEARETRRDVSFCAYAMSAEQIMVVPDAALDPRFADNPLVTGEPSIRFYAGAPLRTADGTALGALCIIDRAPRDGLDDLQRKGLTVLADNIVSLLTMRRSNAEANRELGASDAQFRTLADTMPQMVWSTRPDGYHDYYNARWYEFTGVPHGSTDGEQWNGMFHPDDQARAWTKWRHSLATGAPYEIEYRLRDAQGGYRWTLGRALPIREENGAITRWFGTCTDIHDAKLLLQQRELISHELSHRIKNIFSVIDGLISYTTRSHPEMKPGAKDLRERIYALGRAHDFVRPRNGNEDLIERRQTLHGLVAELLAPYRGAAGDRVLIAGDDVPVDDRAATPLSLLFHELATNAAKYGALKVIEGMVTIESRSNGDHLEIFWREEGGPEVCPPGPDGFGSKLVELSVVEQLRGTLERDWQPQGLVVHVAFPLQAVAPVDVADLAAS